MSNLGTNKKYKRPKQKTQSTTNPESSRQNNRLSEENKAPATCPLAAKDSEWVDILQSPGSEPAPSASVSDEEEVLQLVECEDGPQMKPLAIMFPGLLEKDPNTLEGVLNKVMSTTEVTKHLVDLGQKANFTFMKKADRLIPRDKQWLERLTESSNSITSMASALHISSVSSDYDADNEVSLTLDDDNEATRCKKMKAGTLRIKRPENIPTNMEQIVPEHIQISEKKLQNESMPTKEDVD